LTDKLTLVDFHRGVSITLTVLYRAHWLYKYMLTLVIYMAYTLIHNGSLGKYIGITHYDCLGKSQLNLAELWTLGSGCLIVICTNEIDW